MTALHQLVLERAITEALKLYPEAQVIAEVTGVPVSDAFCALEPPES